MYKSSTRHRRRRRIAYVCVGCCVQCACVCIFSSSCRWLHSPNGKIHFGLFQIISQAATRSHYSSKTHCSYAMAPVEFSSKWKRSKRAQREWNSEKKIWNKYLCRVNSTSSFFLILSHFCSLYYSLFGLFNVASRRCESTIHTQHRKSEQENYIKWKESLSRQRLLAHHDCVVSISTVIHIRALALAQTCTSAPD